MGDGVGRIYHAVIIEASSAAGRERPKGSENLKLGGRFLPGYSLPITIRLHQALQIKTAKPRVGPCEGFCGVLAAWVASVHLRESETRCWGLCEQMWQRAVPTLKPEG